MKVFNLNIEFVKEDFQKKIRQCIETGSKGYICVIDANVLTMAQNDKEYQNIINSAFVNTCDGSSIAGMVNLIYKTKFRAYNGPEIFEEYIERPYKQLLLGNTIEKVDEIKQILKKKDIGNSHLEHYSLPFLEVDEFNYVEIANQINFINPDIIWVSLGAPKQEKFMNKMLPYLNRGLMFGIGAAFNFYTGDLKCYKISLGPFRFIWLERLIKEPGKLWRRIFNYLKILPQLYFSELKRSKYKI